MSTNRQGARARRTFWRARGLFPAAALSAGVLLGSANHAHAQSWRAHAAWVAGQVAGAAVGLENRRPLGPEPELPLPGRPGGGPIEAHSRNWHLTAMGAAGVNVAAPGDDGDDETKPLFYAHAGILYRTGAVVPGYIGVVGAAYIHAGAVGPAALIEAADIITLQAGVLRASGAWHGHVALGVSLPFLGDLGNR